jgi:hypothetical protein
VRPSSRRVLLLVAIAPHSTPLVAIVTAIQLPAWGTPSLAALTALAAGLALTARTALTSSTPLVALLLALPWTFLSALGHDSSC